MRRQNAVVPPQGNPDHLSFGVVPEVGRRISRKGGFAPQDRCFASPASGKTSLSMTGQVSQFSEASGESFKRKAPAWLSLGLLCVHFKNQSRKLTAWRLAA